LGRNYVVQAAGPLEFFLEEGLVRNYHVRSQVLNEVGHKVVHFIDHEVTNAQVGVGNILHAHEGAPGLAHFVFAQFAHEQQLEDALLLLAGLEVDQNAHGEGHVEVQRDSVSQLHVAVAVDVDVFARGVVDVVQVVLAGEVLDQRQFTKQRAFTDFEHVVFLVGVLAEGAAADADLQQIVQALDVQRLVDVFDVEFRLRDEDAQLVRVAQQEETV